MRFLCLVVKLNESHAIFAGSIILSVGYEEKYSKERSNKKSQI